MGSPLLFSYATVLKAIGAHKAYSLIKADSSSPEPIASFQKMFVFKSQNTRIPISIRINQQHMHSVRQ